MRRVLVLVVGGMILGLLGSGAGATTTITFEDLDHGTEVETQYPAVTFNAARIVQCSLAPSACISAFSGTRALQPAEAFEFNNERLRAAFAAPQETVSLWVFAALGEREVTVDAYAGGAVVDTVTAMVAASWSQLTVTAPSGITLVEVRAVRIDDGTEDNQFVIDDLAFDEAVGVTTTTPSGPAPPQVTILSPDDGTVVSGSDNRIMLSYEVRDDGALASIDEVLWREAGDGSRGDEVYRWEECRGALDCFPVPYRGSQTIFLPELGRYHVGIEVTDADGNTVAASVRVFFDEAVDLWVMGMEWNQAVQDVVYTDLDRPVASPGGSVVAPGSSSVPVVPGMPMAVRAYVGLRRPNFVPVLETGLPAVGTLVVDIERSGVTRTLALRPISSMGCANHVGEGGPCLDWILVPLSFGRPVHPRDVELALVDPYYNLTVESRTDYDLDLMWRRVDLRNTLNFVIPGDELEGLGPADRVTMRLEVEPVGHPEATPGDNVYTLDIRDIAPDVALPLEVVRVRMPGWEGGRTPTDAEIDAALDGILHLIPYSRVDEVERTTYRWGGQFMTIRVRLLGFIEVVEQTLSQCDSLFVNLLVNFGVSRSRTLLAFTPSGHRMLEPDGEEGCIGIGWRLPEPFGGTAYAGGIAHTRTPLGEPFWDDVATGAQELYHAHLDRRHAGDWHDERAGCPLDDDALVEALAFVLLHIVVDSQCTKPAAHQHAAIGTYPAAGQPLRGDLGAMGLRLEGGADAGWTLTLFDPCPGDPTVLIDRNDNYRWVDERWRLHSDGVDGCHRTADDRRAHDFMSYGDNRWTSVEQFSAANLEAFGPDTPTLPGVRALRGGLSDPGIEFDDASALRVWGIIDSTGRAGFGGALPFDGLGHQFFGMPGDVSLVVDVLREDGSTLSLPASFSLKSLHGGPPLVLFVVEVPPGPEVVELTLVRDGEPWAEMMASETAPTVRVLWPNGGERWSSDGEHEIAWEAEDADGDDLTFTVQLSRDGGSTWVPIASVTETAISVEAGWLGASDEAVVRVVASDGLRYGVDVSDATFCIGGTGRCEARALEEGEGAGRTLTGVLLALLGLVLLGAVVGASYYVGKRRGSQPETSA